MPFIPAGNSRRMAAGLVLAMLGLASLYCGFEAEQASVRARTRTWVMETEEIGAFVKSALARGNDLLVVERFSRLARRDDVAYVLVMDSTGKARLHTDVSQIGKLYTSDYAKRALGAGDTLVQPVPSQGLVEVDSPLGGAGVLRAGFMVSAATAGSGWMWAGICLALAGLILSFLPALRAADKL